MSSSKALNEKDKLLNSLGVAKELYSTSHYRYKLFCHIVWQICNNNDDVILFLNGPRGKGKSTAGIDLLRYYYEKFIGLPFNKNALLEHVIYEPTQLMDRARNLPRFHPLLIDEGVRVAFTGDFATKDTKDIIKFFAQCRTKNRFLIILSPEFTDIAKRLRNYAKYRIRMIERGVGVLFSKDNSEGVDGFHLDELKENERFYDETSDTEQVLQRLKKHVCYKDTLYFPALPKDINDWYEEYRNLSVYGESERQEGINDRAFLILHNIYYDWEELRLIPKMTALKILEKIAYNPLTNESFWANSTHINQEIRKVHERVTKYKLAGLQKNQNIKSSNEPGQ